MNIAEQEQKGGAWGSAEAGLCSLRRGGRPPPSPAPAREQQLLRSSCRFSNQLRSPVSAPREGVCLSLLSQQLGPGPLGTSSQGPNRALRVKNKKYQATTLDFALLQGAEVGGVSCHRGFPSEAPESGSPPAARFSSRSRWLLLQVPVLKSSISCPTCQK